MRFETNANLQREDRAIEKFCSIFGLTYKKLGSNDVDFQIFKKQKLLGFVEVKGRHRDIEDSYPLPVAVRKLNKLQGNMIPRGGEPILIWACNDGIIYGKIKNLDGSIRYGGRPPRKGSTNDQELMAFYSKQKNLHHSKY